MLAIHLDPTRLTVIKNCKHDFASFFCTIVIKIYNLSSVKTKRDEFSSPSSSHTLDSLHMGTSDHLREREASPEMMKISALVTRPPKQKPSSMYIF